MVQNRLAVSIRGSQSPATELRNLFLGVRADNRVPFEQLRVIVRSQRTHNTAACRRQRDTDPCHGVAWRDTLQV